MDRLQLVLEEAIGRRPRQSVVVIAGISRDVAFLHLIDDQLDMPGIQRLRVRRGGCAVRGQGDGGRGSADNTQRGGVELRGSSSVEPLGGVVLQDLVDDGLDRVLRQVVEFAGVGNRVAGFGDRQGALGDREVGFRHRVGFRQRRAGRSRNVLIHVPEEGVALLLALLSRVLDVAELAELGHRLNGHAEFVGQVVRIHIPAQRIYCPNL